MRIIDAFLLIAWVICVLFTAWSHIWCAKERKKEDIPEEPEENP